MSDPRYAKLADILVNYSCEVKKGDVVQVAGQFSTMPLFKEVVKECYKKGALVRTNLNEEELQYIKFKYASPAVLNAPSKFMKFEAENTDVFISLGGETNTNALTNIDSKVMQMASKANSDIKKIILDKRWVICDFPSTGLAQAAGMSLEEYEDFVLSACLQDWKKMTAECAKLGKLMDKANKVRIKAKETDLTVDITGCPASSSRKERQGMRNMPDGEVFTSPNRYLTEGHIHFPWPSRKAKEVRDVRFWFKKGKIVKATASFNEEYIQQVLNTDKLSNSLGEIAIGLNYGVKKYTNNILYDEKIGGTCHMAIGSGYPEVGGDPNSAVHWDFVKDMREEGEVWFDEKLILKKGKIFM